MTDTKKLPTRWDVWVPRGYTFKKVGQVISDGDTWRLEPTDGSTRLDLHREMTVKGFELVEVRDDD